MMLARYVPVLAIACLAIPFGNEAAATATIGGSISVLAGSGACSDNKLVPLNTPQDTFAQNGAASCSGGSATISMYGDAATVSIGLLGTSSGNGFGSSEAAAQVHLTDHLLLTPPPTTPANSFVSIPVSFKLEGSISPGALFDPSFGRFLSYNLTISDLYAALTPGSSLAAIGNVSATGNFSQTFSGNVNFYNFGSSAVPMTAVVELDMFIPALLEGTIDFYNTASLTMDLPPGFSATTSSGLALAFAQAAVPEPATCALMLSGLALVGFTARRRKQRNA